MFFSVLKRKSPLFCSFPADEDDGDDDCHYQHDQAREQPGDRFYQALNQGKTVEENTTGVVAQEPIDGGPQDAAGGAVDEEGTPVHMVDTCQEGAPGAQYGD